MGAEMLSIGGTEDHVHLLARIPAALSVATLVKQIKGSSSHLVNHCGEASGVFKWQGAYGAFTVSRGSVRKVKDYTFQKQHHAEGTTHEEHEPGG